MKSKARPEYVANDGKDRPTCLRIAILVPFSLDAPIGPKVAVQAMAAGFTALDHTVEIFDLPKSNGIPNSVNALLQTRNWINQVARFQPDIIVVRNQPFAKRILKKIKRACPGAKVVLELHSILSIDLQHRLPRFLRPLSALTKGQEAQACSVADKVRVVTPELKELLTKERTCKTPIKVFPNGSALTTKRRTPDAFRTKFKNKEYDFAYIGELARWQGLDSFLRALSNLKSQGQEANCVIVGDGVMRAELTEQVHALGIEGNVKFLGRVDLASVEKTLDSSLYGVAPFASGRNETIGNSALKIRDYASMGLPITGSAIPGLADEVGQKWYFEAAPADVDAMARQMSKLLKVDVEQYSALAVSATKYARKNYEWRVICKEMIEFYER